jgi:hypothetical protein
LVDSGFELTQNTVVAQKGRKLSFEFICGVCLAAT